MLTVVPRPAPDVAPASRRALRFVGDERALVEGVLAGNEAAAAELYDRYVADLRRILLRVIGPSAELGDLLQDTFVSALGSLGTLQDPAALRGWLIRVAVFTARKHLRSRGRRRWLRLWRDEEEESGELAAVTLPSQSASLAAKEAWQILEELGVEERMAFSLRFIEGLELGEVAAALDCSLSTVKRRLLRAVARFQVRAQRTSALREWLPGGAP